MQARDRLIIAADLSSPEEILRLAGDLQGIAGALKIGLQAFVANGPALVKDVMAAGHRVFLDLKLHDIPNTVRHAVAEAEKLGVAMITVHAAGGRAMLDAARSDRTLILAVTILTSLEDEDLAALGMNGGTAASAVRLARLAGESSIRGVVASPLEIALIRESCGPEMTIVTPGIRPAGAERGDQRRTMTPAEALRAGADYIVVGRPVTAASDRRGAALRLVDEMERAG